MKIKKHFNCENCKEDNEVYYIDRSDEIIEKIKAGMFPFEHYWSGDEKQRLCEICKEVVEKGTPCKESSHYPCYEILSGIKTFVENI